MPDQVIDFSTLDTVVFNGTDLTEVIFNGASIWTYSEPPNIIESNSFEFLTIGDAGNVADTTTYGAVDYEFGISKYAVSISDIIGYNNDHLIPSDEYAYELDEVWASISKQQGTNTNSWYTYVRISSNGQWMVAGDTTNKTVRLYKRNVGTDNKWLQQSNSIVATESEDTGISVDVSNSGTIVFSSPLYDTTPGSNEGRVRVWSLTNGVLLQTGSDFVGAVGEELGTNVTIANSPFTGDIMVAFCSRNGDYVKVYEYSNFTWTQVGSTISLNAPSRLRFSDTGSRLIVGSEITTNGKVQVYEWSGSEWGQIGSDISDLLSWNVGRSVDITGDGNTIAVGGYRDGVITTSDEGFVKVYEWSGSSWDEKGNAEINGPSANSFYGSNIALDDTGTQVVVGNQLNTLLVYQWNGSSWSNSHTITGSAAFGRIAACNSTGEIIITNDYNTGDVYTYINDRRLIPDFQNFSTGDIRPAQGLTWNYAARFVNWLNKRDGYEPAYKFETFGANDNISLLTAGDNGYDADNKFRHSRSVYYLPTEDEWFKAAFYDPNKPGGPGYWLYGVGQDTAPTAVASGTSPGTVVYDSIGTTSAPVTAAGGLSPYGTMGQTGNTYEWMESAYDGTNDVAGESRVNRGGTYVSGNNIFISKSYRTGAPSDFILQSSSSRSLRVAKRNVIIIDNADTGFTTTAGWSEYTGNALISGYNVDLFSAPSGTGSEVATWTFKGLDPGDYEVAITWRERDVSRATDAPFTVFDGNIALSTVDVDMSDVSRPRADYLEGTLAGSEPFEVIFPLVNITSGTLKVELTDNADNFVIADAVRIEPLPSLLLEFVTIGDAGNVADTTTYGAVDYEFGISKYEVREGDITIYNAQATNSARQITFDSRGTDKPATRISWNEAARFVNWLNEREGQQPAYKFTTSGVNDNIELWAVSDDGYDPNNLFRNSYSKYFIPSEDEWYKAAYYKSGSTNAGYWAYATGSDAPPTAVTSGTTAGTAVYTDNFASVVPSEPADVDQAGGLSPYGTMGQDGNAWEWTESAHDGTNDSAAELRAIRGASWNGGSGNIRSTNRSDLSPGFDEFDKQGFRVAKRTAG